MGLRDLAETTPRRDVRSSMCATGQLLRTLTGDDRAWLEEQLASNETGTRIARILQADGHDARAHNLNRHRRGDCQCR